MGREVEREMEKNRGKNFEHIELGVGKGENT